MKIKEVEMPFPKNQRKNVAQAQIIASTRLKRIGKAGDYFWVPESDGRTKCVILANFTIRLWHIAYEFHSAHGYSSSDEFIEAWNKAYPKYPYERYNQCNFWVHIFSPTHEWAGYQPDFELKPSVSQEQTREVKTQ